MHHQNPLHQHPTHNTQHATPLVPLRLCAARFHINREAFVGDGMSMNYLLLRITFNVSVADHTQHTTHPHTTHHTLHTTHHTSHTTHHTPHTTHHTQHTTHHTPHTTQNTPHTTHHTKHTTHNTQHTTHSTQHTTYNTQHTAHSTQHTTHNTTRPTINNTQYTMHNTPPGRPTRWQCLHPTPFLLCPSVKQNAG